MNATAAMNEKRVIVWPEGVSADERARRIADARADLAGDLPPDQRFIARSRARLSFNTDEQVELFARDRIHGLDWFLPSAADFIESHLPPHAECERCGHAVGWHADKAPRDCEFGEEQFGDVEPIECYCSSYVATRQFYGLLNRFSSDVEDFISIDYPDGVSADESWVVAKYLGEQFAALILVAISEWQQTGPVAPKGGAE